MKITELARGAPCQARTTFCNGRNDTSVWCHLNDLFAGKGVGKKSHDALGFIGCSDCHDAYDGRSGMLTREQKRVIGWEAHCRTLAYLLDNDLIEITVKRK